MIFDKRELVEYAFDGLFYEYKTDTSEGLLNQKTIEVEVLRTKCDIQQTSQIGNAGFLASSYTIFFPLKERSAFSHEKSDSEDEDEDESIEPSKQALINDETYEPIPIKRGMYFRGMIYGYEVNGKVIGVAPSMLGGCACQIKDLDE